MRTQTQEQNKNLNFSSIGGRQPSEELINRIPGEYSETISAIKDVIAFGDLSSLSEIARLKYYAAVCDSAQLNPLTRPFDFIEMPDGKGGKKLALYAKKECTEQLRKIHGVSCEKIERIKEDGLYIVIAHLKDKHGRIDESMAALSMLEPEFIKEWNPSTKKYIFKPNPDAGKKLPLNELAILMMKTETKAKRRGTLSICGLGILDELELETLPAEKFIPAQEQVKIEDYKISIGHENSKPEEPEELATADQIETIKYLAKELGKGDSYIAQLLTARFGHADVTKVSQKFMAGWIEKLQTQANEKEKFLAEYDSAEGPEGSGDAA